MSVKLTPRVNFTNILHKAFALKDPKSTKRHWLLYCLFALLGSSRVKAAHRMLVKLTPTLLKELTKRFEDLRRVSVTTEIPPRESKLSTGTEFRYLKPIWNQIRNNSNNTWHSRAVVFNVDNMAANQRLMLKYFAAHHTSFEQFFLLIPDLKLN
jgi:hypothetical protein